MDINTLLSDAKARFSHNSAKHYLKEKYSSKLTVADQGGLWKADKETISILNSLQGDKVIIMDTFENPVEVDRVELLSKLTTIYNETMVSWLKELKELESKR